MPIHIRLAEFGSDRAALVEMVRANLTPSSNDKRFSWLYQRGPHGAARAWIAFDSANGAVAGVAAAFPRRIWLEGTEGIAWVFGDFCMNPAYRTLGPAIQLQRRCIESLSQEACEFCYDFPSEKMMAIYSRMGIEQRGTLVRWAKPLRIEQRVESALHSRVLAQGAGRLINTVLTRQGWKGTDDVCDLAMHAGRCGEEFSLLDSQLCHKPCIRTLRTAEYLNWRYLDHPENHYEILTARRDGILVGYAIFSEEPNGGGVADLCAVEEQAVIARLLAGVVEILRRRGAASVSLRAGDSHPWNRVFERAGFRRREETPLVLHVLSNRLQRLKQQACWHLMQGERDS